MDVQVSPYVVLASALLALAGFYVPGFSGWYGKQESGRKQLIMLAAIFTVVAARFGLGCLALLEPAYTCDAPGVFDAVVEFVMAIAVNAGVYKATNYMQKPKPEEPDWNQFISE